MEEYPIIERKIEKISNQVATELLQKCNRFLCMMTEKCQKNIFC